MSKVGVVRVKLNERIDLYTFTLYLDLLLQKKIIINFELSV